MSTRALEVSVLQTSPLLGASLGGLHRHVLLRSGLMLLGSLLLTAHVFLFNDWVDYARCAHDPRRAGSGYGIPTAAIARGAIALLIVANVTFALVGAPAVLFGGAIAAISLLYSFSPRFGKGTPGAASLNHLIGGSLHFLLGYSVAHAVDARGIAISVFFGLVFAAGHLNQEVRDHDADRGNGVRTVAVAFGCRRAFVASMGVFTVAYALIVGLAAVGELPEIMLASAAIWSVQARWSLQALRRGVESETALWMQRRYRLLLACVGLAMLIQ